VSASLASSAPPPSRATSSEIISLGKLLSFSCGNALFAGGKST